MENMKDSLSYLAVPKHMFLALQCPSFVNSLLGSPFSIREWGVGPISNKGGWQMELATSAGEGDVMASCRLDTIDLETPSNLLPLVATDVKL